MRICDWCWHELHHVVRAAGAVMLANADDEPMTTGAELCEEHLLRAHELIGETNADVIDLTGLFSDGG